MNGVILTVSKVASSMSDLIFHCLRAENNQRPLSIFNPENEAVQHMRSKEADKEKKQRNVSGSSLLLTWARSKSDTTEPICLDCEIHLISSPRLFQSHKSNWKLMFAVSFQNTVFNRFLFTSCLSLAAAWLHWPVSPPLIEVKFKWNSCGRFLARRLWC